MSDNLSIAYTDATQQVLEVPSFAAGSFTVQSTGTEVLLLIQRAVPAIGIVSKILSDQPINTTVALVSISPATAKDLLTLLGQVVDHHERTVGPITTPFTTQRKEQERAPGANEVTLDQFRLRK